MSTFTRARIIAATGALAVSALLGATVVAGPAMEHEVTVAMEHESVPAPHHDISVALAGPDVKYHG